MDIYRVCKQIFHKFYDGRSVRVIHVSLENLMDEESLQLSLFEDRTKERALAKAMDAIRDKFGPNALLRAVSYNCKLAHYFRITFSNYFRWILK